MINLREKIEADLSTTLEGRFGLPVVLLSPDGERQTHSKNDPEQLLQAQVIYDTLQDNPDSGAEVIVHKPVITLRKSSLDRVPLPGERWAFSVPEEPRRDADQVWYLAERPREDGSSIGFVRLYGVKMSEAPP